MKVAIQGLPRKPWQILATGLGIVMFFDVWCSHNWFISRANLGMAGIVSIGDLGSNMLGQHLIIQVPSICNPVNFVKYPHFDNWLHLQHFIT